MEDLKKLKDDLTAVGKDISGQIIMKASTIPSAFILPHLAADFKKIHQNISFEIRTSDSANVIDSVLNNEILLGFTGARTEAKKLHFYPFREDQLVLAASTKMTINKRVTTRTLLELPFILREEGSGTRKSMERFLAEKNIGVDQLNICAVLGSSTAVSEAIKYNMGVSIISRHAVNDGVEHGRIQIIDILNLEMKRSFYAVTAEKRSLPHHYQAFLKYLLS